MLRPLNVASAAPVTPSFRKGAKAEDQARIQNQVEDVRDPQQTHCYGGVAGSAKDGVVEEKHQNDTGAAKRDPSV